MHRVNKTGCHLLPMAEIVGHTYGRMKFSGETFLYKENEELSHVKLMLNHLNCIFKKLVMQLQSGFIVQCNHC